MSRMPDTYKGALKWAKARAGKRVYRKFLTCECGVCKDVEANGIVIQDGYHASYITDHAMEIGYRYADSLEELETMNERPPFISGWLAFTLSLLIVLGLPTFIWHTTGHNALSASNWWWWVGMLA